jgi:sec-independent protein translocase protein TatB
MFDVGFPELMMIGAVALIVIGPERLPDVARKVGRWVSKIQRFVKGVRSDVARELESGELKALIGDQRNQINELRQMVTDATKDIEKTTTDAVKEAESSFDEIQQNVSETSTEADKASLAIDDPGADASTNQSDK